MALGSTQPLTEMSTRNTSWGVKRPVCRADNHITFMCWLSWNLGASNSWNPQGLSRPVMGLLYILPLRICTTCRNMKKLCILTKTASICFVWLSFRAPIYLISSPPPKKIFLCDIPL
jgi:hypothetical protein